MLQTCFFLVLRIISNPLANFFQKKLTVFESSLTVNFYTSVFMLLLCFPFVPGVNLSGFSPSFYFYVFLSGMFCFLGTICLIKALSLGELSVLGPINSYKSVIGLIFGYFFLGEIPSARGFLGFILIIAASFLFLDENGRFILNKSVLLRLLALVFTGIEACLLKKIIVASSPVTCLIFWCITGFLFSGGFAFIFGKISCKLHSSLFTCFLIAILLFIMQFSTNYVFYGLNVGLSLALFQLSSVISLILGFKFFREKGIIKKSLGTLIMLLGSFLILVK